VSAAAGDAVFAGQRRALEEARGRAGGRRVRLVRLSATRPGDLRWDPGTVRENAERARKDPSSIAYLGELDYGGSAVSLPVTNRADLLQVSPTDGLTSLTRTSPGRPRAGPARYYPEGIRTFARLVPNDLVVAEDLEALLRERGVTRVAIVNGEGFADRELAVGLVNLVRRGGARPAFVETLPDNLDRVPGLVERLAASRPGAVVLVGMPAPAMEGMLAALARRQPGVPVLGTAGLAGSRLPAGARPREVSAVTQVLPAPAQSGAGRRLLATIARERGMPARPESVYGFATMRLVLRAIDDAGPDRRAVVRAALAPGERRTVLGRLALDSGGDVRTRRLALMRFRGGKPTVERVLP